MRFSAVRNEAARGIEAASRRRFGVEFAGDVACWDSGIVLSGELVDRFKADRPLAFLSETMKCRRLMRRDR